MSRPSRADLEFQKKRQAWRRVIKAILLRSGWSHAELGRHIKVSANSVRNWLYKSSLPSELHRQLIQQKLVTLDHNLADCFSIKTLSIPVDTQEGIEALVARARQSLTTFEVYQVLSRLGETLTILIRERVLTVFNIETLSSLGSSQRCTLRLYTTTVLPYRLEVHLQFYPTLRSVGYDLVQIFGDQASEPRPQEVSDRSVTRLIKQLKGLIPEPYESKKEPSVPGIFDETHSDRRKSQPY